MFEWLIILAISVVIGIAAWATDDDENYLD